MADDGDSVTKNQGSDKPGENQGNANYQHDFSGEIISNLKKADKMQQNSHSNPLNEGIRIIGNKKGEHLMGWIDK